MKIQLIALFICTIGFLTSCEKDDTAQRPENNLEGLWSITNMSGGFAGLDCDYDAGLITWEITATKIKVTNNYIGIILCSGPVASEHTYSILESNGNTYLVLDGTENGQIVITDSKLTLDQNIFSSGSGADGFVYVLEK